ncbi:hypothetical protein SBRCBS47491_005304 [Sporothrix bragantina]|uniref:Carotenoid cleavage dioxygenase 1 n=1 Tax=Sporothrix bragantina TaxID=671064 RepID=A0ABP0BVM5_9PEZI
MGSVAVAIPAEASLTSKLPYRTTAEEADDCKNAFERFTKNEFVDWPNEAGFEDLREERGPIQIPVVGSIPVWAAGNLYRTGPGGRKVEGTPKGDFVISHWFDGLAHTHRFEIAPTADGKSVDVFYSSRRQCDARVKYIQEHGASKLFTFAQRSDPCVGMLGKFMSTFKAAAMRNGTNMGDIENMNVVVNFDMPGTTVKKTAESARAAKAAKDANKAAAKSGGPAVVGHRTKLPDDLWISTDANYVRRLDPATLEPIGVAAQDCLHPDLKGPLSCAHGHRDIVTGDMFQYNLDPGATPVYRVFRVSKATGKTTILATIRCRNGVSASSNAGPEAVSGSTQTVYSNARPAYIHSFFMSERYLILCIPCSHIAQNGIKLLWERNIVDGLEPFSPANKTRWIVIDKQPQGRGVVAEFESDAAFFFHTVNAFDEVDPSDGSTRIACDLVQYGSSTLLQALEYDVLMNRNNAGVEYYKNPEHIKNHTAQLRRFYFRLPAAGQPLPSKTLPAELAFTIASPHCGELPTINSRCHTKPHRYIYAVGNHGRAMIADSIVKTDTATCAALVWHAPQAHTPGEAIFVQRPAEDGSAGEQDEDDGVLLSVVLDGLAAKSYLLCLDARTMKEVGRAEVGFAIGFGFHGAHAKNI